MRQRITRAGSGAGAAMVAALFGAACSGTTTGTTESFDQLDVDAAVVAADGVLGDLEALGECGTGELPAGLQRSCTVRYFDGSGNEQDSYDELTTASIEIVTESSGEFTRESWSATISRERAMTISGLEGEEATRIVNGAGSATIVRSRHSDENGTRTYEMLSSSSIDQLVRGVPLEENPYPLSGTITRDMTITITGGENDGATRSRTVVTTFNGTQFATVTVNGETFEIDLDARRGQGPMRRGPRGR